MARLTASLDAPPSYEEAQSTTPEPSTIIDLGPPALSSPSQDQQQSDSSASSPTLSKFPPVFKLYKESWALGTFKIGTHKNRPLYLMAVHPRGYGPHDLELHDGLTRVSPLLATLDCGDMSPPMTVSIPTRPVQHADETSEVHTLKAHSRGVGRMIYRFSIDVGPDKGAAKRLEMFEWRRSYTAANKVLGGSCRGWKLVRLHQDLPPGLAEEVVPRGPTTSDGWEVVAACSDGLENPDRLAKFVFIGTGLSPEMGQQWATMAVMTGLGFWLWLYRIRLRRETRTRLRDDVF